MSVLERLAKWRGSNRSRYVLIEHDDTSFVTDCNGWVVELYWEGGGGIVVLPDNMNGPGLCGRSANQLAIPINDNNPRPITLEETITAALDYAIREGADIL